MKKKDFQFIEKHDFQEKFDRVIALYEQKNGNPIRQYQSELMFKTFGISLDEIEAEEQQQRQKKELRKQQRAAAPPPPPVQPDSKPQVTEVPETTNPPENTSPDMPKRHEEKTELMPPERPQLKEEMIVPDLAETNTFEEELHASPEVVSMDPSPVDESEVTIQETSINTETQLEIPAVEEKREEAVIKEEIEIKNEPVEENELPKEETRNFPETKTSTPESIREPVSEVVSNKPAPEVPKSIPEAKEEEEQPQQPIKEETESAKPIDLFTFLPKEPKHETANPTTKPKTLLDQLTEDKTKSSLHDSFNSKGISIDQIPVHKQFQFVQHLFKGSNVKFKVVMGKLSEAKTIAEAEEMMNKYIFNSSDVQRSDRISKEFVALITGNE